MLIISGPCALESRRQLKECVTFLTGVGVVIIRACLWKPRTTPGWDGMGADGIPILLEETLPYHKIPATEIISSEHAQALVDGLRPYGDNAPLLVWIGARNQNHFELRKIAQVLSQGPKGIFLMFKNQMWVDKKHWIGIYQHIIEAGFPRERLWTCHRGFNVGYGADGRGLRNIPDFAMATQVKNEINIPMLLDPSHIAGKASKVCDIVREANQYPIDGFMIECHNNIKDAKTDIGQQLSFQQIEEVLNAIPSFEPVFA